MFHIRKSSKKDKNESKKTVVSAPATIEEPVQKIAPAKISEDEALIALKEYQAACKTSLGYCEDAKQYSEENKPDYVKIAHELASEYQARADKKANDLLQLLATISPASLAKITLDLAKQLAKQEAVNNIQLPKLEKAHAANLLLFTQVKSERLQLLEDENNTLKKQLEELQIAEQDGEKENPTNSPGLFADTCSIM